MNLNESLSLLESVLAAGPAGFGFIDREYRYRRINSELAELNRVTREDHLGRTMEEVLGTSAWETMKPLVDQAIVGVPNVDIELFALKLGRDGHRTHVRVSCIPLSIGGQIVGLITLVKDTTRRTEEQIALQESEARYRRIVETAREGVWIIDEHNDTTFVNNQMATMLGYEACDMIGCTLFDFMDERGEALALDNIQRRRDGIDESHDFLYRTKDGSDLWAIVSTNPIFDANGEYKGALGMLTDITDRKHAEIEREQMLHQERRARIDAERAEREKTELLKALQDSNEQQRRFLSDMLYAVSEKRFTLCWDQAELPQKIGSCDTALEQSINGGMSELRKLIRSVCDRMGYTVDRVQDLAIAASEAAMNAVVHAGGGLASVCSDKNGPIQIWISDNGTGISMQSMPRAVLERGFTTAGTLGHGMKMMMQTIDRLWLLTGPEGTTVVMEQDKNRQEPLFDS